MIVITELGYTAFDKIRRLCHLCRHIMEEGGLHTVGTLCISIGMTQLLATRGQHARHLLKFGRLTHQRTLHLLKSVLQLTYLVATAGIGYNLIVMSIGHAT